jgi:hypothetical protein
VVIQLPKPQVYTITVSAGELSEADKQAYSLVVTGMGSALPRGKGEGPVPSTPPEADPGWSEDGSSSSPLKLDLLLHPCYAACMAKGGARGDGVCDVLGRGVANCSAACPQAAVVEAKEVCLGYGCDFVVCGVKGDEQEQVKRFKVQARIILRGE